MNLNEKCVNTIRFLAVDAIQKANSGHPGLPLGAAPAAFSLFAFNMSHNPKNPGWQNRDRFVLSAGHGSALLYAMLHLFSYGVTKDDLKSFRQLDSKTPGHPEYRHTPGVETTTGPLGQGIANAVGMAMAETMIAAHFNKPEFPVMDHYTFCMCGDGCLMEGVASEAASLAGTLKLGKLILLYDSNNITIEGNTNIAFREDVRGRFKAYGWQTLVVEDGNDLDAISAAIKAAKGEQDRPTIIEIKTQIGFGAPNKQGKASAHGEPLGDVEIALTKKALGWEHDESFFVPEDVKRYIDEGIVYGEKAEQGWNALFADYRAKYPELAAEWDKWFSGEVDCAFMEQDDFWQAEGNVATRVSSETVLNKVAAHVPNLVGGSADLAPSNKSVMKGLGDYGADDRTGRNLHYGIREFGMTAIANGIALHGGLRNYVAGFFVFSDYMKPALRMAALMNLPVVSILTHDSIGVGEDGPTHQPIEQLAGLRSIPNMVVFRPCDTKETAAAWVCALKRQGPTALALSRQNLPTIPESGKGALNGAYILKDSEHEVPDVILMASGSEVSLVYEAADVLGQKGVFARVVSMPSWELFEAQPDAYKESILPKAVKNRVAVEAASSFGWHRYTGFDGAILCRDGFGASAPAEQLFKQFGFTVDRVVELTLGMLERNKK